MVFEENVDNDFWEITLVNLLGELDTRMEKPLVKGLQ